MIKNRRVLAVIPARSGSKGIPNKNMAVIGGLSLIARAGKVLSEIPWIDRRVISTDSPAYAAEARAHSIDAPFLRPKELSTDASTALEMLIHAVQTCERLDGQEYDLILLAEPTSPLRERRDIEFTVETLLNTGADTALTVSQADTKNHPDKVFRFVDGRLSFYTLPGSIVTNRQSLEKLYSRNGLCYCFRRETLLQKKTLLTENTVPVLTERPVANIDEPIDLLWAEFLLEHRENSNQ